jgi:hypothetical protein
MKRSYVHRWLILAIAIFAVVLGPINAATSRTAMATASMDATMDDMPCCPNGQPVTPDCQKACQLLVTCTSNYVSGLPINSPVRFVFLTTRSLDKPDSDFLDGPLGIKPPARPPRT